MIMSKNDLMLTFLKIFFFCLSISLLFSVTQCGGSSNQSSIDPSLSSLRCGDGSLIGSESCDDGNLENSDGCNAHCALEVGEAICGNSVLENQECCDDGNNVDGDGCNGNCTLGITNRPPSAPLLTEQPADRSTWSPSRLYLSWSPAIDPDTNDSLTYDVYFDEGNGLAPNAVPYKTGIAENHFIIQSSTDNRAAYFSNTVSAIYLEPNKTYSWKVCARDRFNISSCSSERIFNTDDSIVGWWRFDEDQNGNLCPSNLGKIGAPAGDVDETICDYSGRGNHGSFGGQISILQNVDSALLGKIANIEGITTFDYNSSLAPTSFSISTTFKTSLASNQNLFCKMLMFQPPPRAMGFIEYSISFLGDASPLRINFTLSNSLRENVARSTNAIIQLNHRHRLITSFDNENKKMVIFLDGNLILEEILPSNFQRANFLQDPTYIGLCPIYSSFKGEIDDIFLTNKAFNREEMLNYNLAVQ